MVDRDRREAIRKVAMMGGAVAGIGGLSYSGAHAVSDIYEDLERKDNAISPETEVTQVEEKYNGKKWELTAIDPDAIEVSLERTGETRAGVTEYTATARASLDDPDIRICPHTTTPGSETALARKLEDDAIRLFDGLYDKTARLTPPYRDRVEERIVEYRVGFTDETGVAVADITGREAYHIAQEADWFDPGNGTDRDNFLDTYHRAFDARCFDRGR